MWTFFATLRAILNFVFNVFIFLGKLLFIVPWSAPFATYYLYQNAINSRLQLDTTTNTNLLNGNLTTLVLVHGWTENSSIPYYNQIAVEYQKRKELYNIIMVDWSKYADTFGYIESALSCVDVGNSIANFLMDLQNQKCILINNTNVIAHSLGAQVTSNIAKQIIATSKYDKLWRIDALDAAGPLFEPQFITDIYSLNASDATVVNDLHTEAGEFGIVAPVGTVNFYANGGTAQPGCDALNVSCSHDRSQQYYVESINSNIFIARNCTTNCGDFTTMVYGAGTPDDATGTWWFDTNAQYPFAKG